MPEESKADHRHAAEEVEPAPADHVGGTVWCGAEAVQEVDEEDDARHAVDDRHDLDDLRVTREQGDPTLMIEKTDRPRTKSSQPWFLIRLGGVVAVMARIVSPPDPWPPVYPAPVTRAFVPDEILDLAHARAQARERRDWAEADRLRAAIEAAGWRIVDRGTDFALTPADAARPGRGRARPVRREPERAVAARRCPDRARDRHRPGDRLARRSGAGPRRPARVIAGRDVGGHRRGRPVGRPGGRARRARGATASEPTPEIVWTSERLGHAAAINAGIRRASGPVVIVLDTSVEPQGDIVTPLVEALGDPTVGVAGAWGLVSG